jgi:regulator of protease activity HflC (stomatin/prohibitin superfamily)
MIVMIMSLTGCIKPYDKPEFVTIEASQTAFLVPLTGDTSEQASFASEELLEQAKVATKEVQIPHRWVQLGRANWNGEWRDSAKLIVVERKPVTREWASDKETATSNANKAIFGESLDSVGFYVGMNCSAQINEEDATKFLYRYNNKPLEEIIDTDIRSMVEKEFNEETGKYLLEQIHANKATIMDNITKTVIDYFKEYGITITVLGMKEGISYENEEIQKAIDEKFSSEQKIITQQNLNQVEVSKAQAEAEAKLIAAQAEAEANRLLSASLTNEIIRFKEAENETLMYEKWNGQMPQVQGVGSTIVDLTTNTNTNNQ